MPFTRIFLMCFACVGFVVPVHGEVRVVASIKPVHSLVSSVMMGVGEPSLIVEGAGTPHHYALRPSQARLVEQADIIFWISRDLETFLQKSVETLGASAKSVELRDIPNVVHHRLREGRNFAAHSDAHQHEGEAHDHSASEPHDGVAIDTHLWLDPENAKHFVMEIASILAASDPANAETYRRNAVRTTRRLTTLVASIDELLEPVRAKSFIVFHDAYLYFERRFGLQASASIAVDPHIGTGARQMRHVREEIRASGVECVFSEPQFDPELVSVATENLPARTAVLDPLGAELREGPGQYFELLQEMAQSFRTCLGG